MPRSFPQSSVLLAATGAIEQLRMHESAAKPPSSAVDDIRTHAAELTAASSRRLSSPARALNAALDEAAAHARRRTAPSRAQEAVQSAAIEQSHDQSKAVADLASSEATDSHSRQVSACRAASKSDSDPQIPGQALHGPATQANPEAVGTESAKEAVFGPSASDSSSRTAAVSGKGHVHLADAVTCALTKQARKTATGGASAAMGHWPPVTTAAKAPTMPEGLARILERDNWVRDAPHDPLHALEPQVSTAAERAAGVLDRDALARARTGPDKCAGGAPEREDVGHFLERLRPPLSAAAPQVVTFPSARSAQHRAAADSAGACALHQRRCCACGVTSKRVDHDSDAATRTAPQQPAPEHEIVAGFAAASNTRPGEGASAHAGRRGRPPREPITPPACSAPPKVTVEVNSRFDSQLGFVDGLYDAETDTLFLC